MSQEAKYEERLLDEVIPHPRQQQHFPGMDDARLRALADDIERNDLRESPEIMPENAAGLPPNTIVSGHQRVRALKLLGYEVAEFLVRYDLAKTSAGDVERYFLESNQNRQHLSKLQQAQIALRVFELDKQRTRNELCDWETEEARDRVGQQIGMSGRNLQRYWRVLQAPIEIQHALDQGLPLVLASRVAGLVPHKQQQIAHRIRNGEDAREVVEEQFQSKKGPKPIDQALRHFGKKLEQAVAEIEPRLAEIKTAPPQNLPKLLHRADQLIDKLTLCFQKNQAHYQRNVDDTLEDLD
jgi:hypothetical protein